MDRRTFLSSVVAAVVGDRTRRTRGRSAGDGAGATGGGGPGPPGGGNYRAVASPRTDLRVAWRVEGGGTGLARDPIRVYAAGDGLRAVGTGGETAWRRPGRWRAVRAGDDRVYAVGDRLYALDPADGTTEWTAPRPIDVAVPGGSTGTDGPAETDGSTGTDGPAETDGSTGTGGPFALFDRDGTTVLTALAPDGGRRWERPTGLDGVAGVTAGRGRAFAADLTSVVCFDAATGRVAWRRGIRTDPAVGVVPTDGGAYCVHWGLRRVGPAGRPASTHRPRGQRLGSLAVGPRLVYASGYGPGPGSLWAFDRRRERFVWTLSPAGRLLAASAVAVYVATPTGLAAVDPSGRVLDGVEVGRPARSVAVGRGRLYVADDRSVYAVGGDRTAPAAGPRSKRDA